MKVSQHLNFPALQVLSYPLDPFLAERLPNRMNTGNVFSVACLMPYVLAVILATVHVGFSHSLTGSNG